MSRTLLASVGLAAVVGAQSSLQPLAWIPMRAGSIQPTGWLLDELELHATGLPGLMNEFWEPLNNTQWLGGTSTFEDWGEIGPYIFDGAVALACAVNGSQPRVYSLVASWMDYLVTHQLANGTLGPEGNNDVFGMWYWVRWPVMKAMLQWLDCTGDERMYPAIMAWQREAAARLESPQWPLGYTWQGVRWADWVHVNQMLIDTYAPASDIPFLANLSATVYSQALAAGVDWERQWYVQGWFPTGAVPGGECNLTNHGVNSAQALKSGAILYRMTGDALGITSSYDRLRLLGTYHGVPANLFQADEHLAGNMPSHGTETCAVVEGMFSLNVMHEVLGDPYFADWSEHLLYNAMPGSMTKDIWTRVYLQSSNEIAAVPQTDHVWISDGPDSERYTLDANYACCTSTMGTGFPKSVQRMVHTSPDGGFAVSLYGPVVATAPNGAVLNMSTDYPFDDNVTLTVTGVPAGGMNLYLRIPTWATGATLQLQGGAILPVGAANGSMFKLSMPAGTWSAVLCTAPTLRASTWYNGAIAIMRGPFVFSLQLQEVFAIVQQYAYKSVDYNVTMGNASTPWNVALVMDPSQPLEQYFTFLRVGPVPALPFSSQAQPVRLVAKAVQVTAWMTNLGQPAEPPTSPVDCSSGNACSAPFQVTLVPYGTTHLRMTELPYVLPPGADATAAAAAAAALPHASIV